MTDVTGLPHLPNWQYAVRVRFAGQVAVVTGGALGIGGGISRRLAAAGAHVVLADINADAASASHDDITAAGGRCTVVVGDIRDRDVVAEVTKTALAVEDSRIDILVNNVGDFRPAARDFLHSTEDQWQTLYELNLLHVLRMCHAVLPAMVDGGRGAIVNNATVEAFRGIPYAAPYAAFNAGVVAFTRSLAVDVAHHGIRVNAIAPGPRRHGAEARRAHAARPRPRPDQDLDPGGPLRQARRLRGGRGIPGIGRRAVRHRADDPGGRRHAGRFRVVCPCRPQGLDEYAQRAMKTLMSACATSYLPFRRFCVQTVSTREMERLPSNEERPRRLQTQARGVAELEGVRHV